MNSGEVCFLFIDFGPGSYRKLIDDFSNTFDGQAVARGLCACNPKLETWNLKLVTRNPKLGTRNYFFLLTISNFW